MTDWTDVLLGAIVLLPFADAYVTVFFARLFLRSQAGLKPPAGQSGEPRSLGGRSWLLALLTSSFAIITVVFAYLAFLTARRLLGLPVIPALQPIAALLLLVLGSIPLMFYVAFQPARRKRGGAPPPFSERD